MKYAKKLKQKFLIFSLMLVCCSYSAIASEANFHHRPKYFIPTSYSTDSPPAGALTPAFVRSWYGLDEVKNQGNGQVIAIIDASDHPTIESDLATFSDAFGLPECSTANGLFEKIFVTPDNPPRVDYGWNSEIALDVEWAHAIAPEAKILLVESTEGDSTSLMNAVNLAIQKGANVISMSWGWGGAITEFEDIFKTNNVTFVASSGDYGYSCPLWPAISPNVLCVGGTLLTTDINNNNIEVAVNFSGGGFVNDEEEAEWQQCFVKNDSENPPRATPDVAMVAVNLPIYDTTNGGWGVTGGTSASAPQWAGVIAVLNSSIPPNRYVNAESLYNIACNDQLDTFFNDITLGNNCWGCGTNDENVCNAQVGYDLVTGLGTPKVNWLYKTILHYAIKKTNKGH